LFSSPDDIAFISALIDRVLVKYRVDKERVYSCGLSNGGILSYYLACNLSNKIAAIASVAGTMFNMWYYNCKPKTAMPVMEIHGTDDTTVPYDGSSGGGIYMPIDTVIKKWVEHNGCNSTPVTMQLADVNTTDLSTVTHYVYQGGIDGSSVELYKVIGGGHSWPGAVPVIYKTNEDFSASIEIWRFFRKYKLSQFVSPLSVHSIIPGKNIEVYPNPVNNVLNIRSGAENVITLKNELGQVLYQAADLNRLDLSDFMPGFYLLEVRSGNEQLVVKVLKQ
jgi:polyhydroxybutyrate depolymerase